MSMPGDVLPPPAPIPQFLSDRQPSQIVGSQRGNSILLPGMKEISDPTVLRYGEMRVTEALRKGAKAYDDLTLALSALMRLDRENQGRLTDQARHDDLKMATDSLIANEVTAANKWRAETMETVRVTLLELQHLLPAESATEEMRDIEIRRYVAERPSPEMFLANCVLERDLVSIRAILRGRPFLSGLREDDPSWTTAKKSLVSVNIQSKLDADKTYRNPLNSLLGLVEGQESLRLAIHRGLSAVLSILHDPPTMARLLREHAWNADQALVAEIRELNGPTGSLPTLQTMAEPEINSSLAA